MNSHLYLPNKHGFNIVLSMCIYFTPLLVLRVQSALLLEIIMYCANKKLTPHYFAAQLISKLLDQVRKQLQVHSYF